MYYNYKELHQAVKCKKSGENRKAKALRSLREAKDKGTYVYDMSSEEKIQTRPCFPAPDSIARRGVKYALELNCR